MALTSSHMVTPLGGLQALPSLTVASSKQLTSSGFATQSRSLKSLAGKVRCEASNDGRGSGLAGLKQEVDRLTKKEVTRDAILKNQEINESEQRSVFGAKPNSGSVYPRPELERRPETGDKSFVSVFAFDGPAPETINCRLAMLGIVWAFVAEKMTGLTVLEQLFNPGSVGLVFFVGAVQLFTYASLVPIVNGESTDFRSWGPSQQRLSVGMDVWL